MSPVQSLLKGKDRPAADAAVCTVPSDSAIVAVSATYEVTNIPRLQPSNWPATGSLLLILIGRPGGQLQLIVDLFQ